MLAWSLGTDMTESQLLDIVQAKILHHTWPQSHAEYGHYRGLLCGDQAHQWSSQK